MTRLLPVLSCNTKHHSTRVISKTNRKLRELFDQYKDREKEIDVSGEWLFVTIHTATGVQEWIYPT